MSEIKRMRERLDLTQKEAADKLDMNRHTFGKYERGERTPDYKTMDKIRRVLGEGESGSVVSRAGSQDHLQRVTVRPAGAGPGKSTGGTEEILLDRRLLDGSGIDIDGHQFVRVVGSSMEPVLRHGQIVLVAPCEQVHGDDIYVYWSSAEGGHIVALLSKTSTGIEVQKHGPKPRTMNYTHLHNHTYEDEGEQQVEIHLIGRVIGSVGRPSQSLARENAAARHAQQAG